MKTVIFAAVAALSLGVGSAYAAGGAGGNGGPAGYEEPHHGAAAFSDHAAHAQVQFLGPNTVLGKMFGYNSESNRVAAATTSAKGS